MTDDYEEVIRDRHVTVAERDGPSWGARGRRGIPHRQRRCPSRPIAEVGSCGRSVNCIAHLLSKIPYQEKPLPDIEIPERQSNEGYVRPPLEMYTYVPDHTAELAD